MAEGLRAPRYTTSRRVGLMVGLLAAIVATGTAPSGTVAQDWNFVLPIPEIETHLGDMPFEILEREGSRMPEDRTQRVRLGFEDGSIMVAKWATAPPGGSRFNNEPRYELGAYRIQKLFLDESEYVVPPTVLRSFPREHLDAEDAGAPATFRDTESVLVVLQYWLGSVTPADVWDPQRMQHDSLYARHIGNLNVLTYLIRHADSNHGNFLISVNPASPRAFAVDNGIAFNSPPSDRGDDWRHVRVDRLPLRTVERLRSLTRDDFERALAVLAEFEDQNGVLVPVEPGENLARHRGVRRSGGRVQFGLTASEIRDVELRRTRLLQMVDRRHVTTF